MSITGGAGTAALAGGAAFTGNAAGVASADAMEALVTTPAIVATTTATEADRNVGPRQLRNDDCDGSGMATTVDLAPALAAG
jgi:hypothetical protein